MSFVRRSREAAAPPAPVDGEGAAEAAEKARVTGAQSDPQAFAALYDQHYDDVLSFLYRRCFDALLAEELTSRAFFQALRALPRFQHRCPFRFWLYRIALNELRMHWRRERRTVPLGDDDDRRHAELARVQFADEACDAEERLLRMAVFRQVNGLLDSLPARYRVPLSLRYFEGLSYEEIAHVTSKRLGTVKSLLHRGLKRLRSEAECRGLHPFPSQGGEDNGPQGGQGGES